MVERANAFTKIRHGIEKIFVLCLKETVLSDCFD